MLDNYSMRYSLFQLHLSTQISNSHFCIATTTTSAHLCTHCAATCQTQGSQFRELRLRWRCPFFGVDSNFSLGSIHDVFSPPAAPCDCWMTAVTMLPLQPASGFGLGLPVLLPWLVHALTASSCGSHQASQSVLQSSLWSRLVVPQEHTP
jgi:hypothetical protein